MLDHNATNGAFILPASTPTTHLYDSAGNYPFGVMINAPKLGEAAQIVIMGETKVLAYDNSIVAGSPITFNQYGFVLAAASTDVVIGFARYASTAKGDLVTALIIPAMTFNS